LANLGIAEERVHVLRNGVDPALFRPTNRDAARRALGLIRPTRLAIGNLVRLKSHRMIIEALVSLLAADIVAVPEAGRILREHTAERLAETAREFLAALPATRGYAEGFDWQSTTEGQVTLFDEICKHRPGRRGVGHTA
jgi:hypothetical protein